jgi:hypothetical protein
MSPLQVFPAGFTILFGARQVGIDPKIGRAVAMDKIAARPRPGPDRRPRAVEVLRAVREIC